MKFDTRIRDTKLQKYFQNQSVIIQNYKATYMYGGEYNKNTLDYSE